MIDTELTDRSVVVARADFQRLGLADVVGQAVRDALRSATEALNQATTPFAARRMDARVREALAGQRLDQLAA